MFIAIVNGNVAVWKEYRVAWSSTEEIFEWADKNLDEEDRVVAYPLVDCEGLNAGES